MKSSSIIVSAGTVMPSPKFLWRFKAVLFVTWGISCCQISWDSVMRMSFDKRDLFLYEAFLYYNPLLLVSLMVWLWGVNLWVFSQSSVKYAKIFDLDHTHLNHWEIWKCAIWMTIIVPMSMTSYLYLYSHGEVSLAALQPVLLYAITLMVLIFPFDIFYLSSRYYFLKTLWRMVLPLQAITFSDFFLADILTSMSKVLSDLERSVCRMVNRQGGSRDLQAAGLQQEAEVDEQDLGCRLQRCSRRLRRRCRLLRRTADELADSWTAENELAQTRTTWRLVEV